MSELGDIDAYRTATPPEYAEDYDALCERELDRAADYERHREDELRDDAVFALILFFGAFRTQPDDIEF
jgi:hypothetical protein